MANPESDLNLQGPRSGNDALPIAAIALLLLRNLRLLMGAGFALAVILVGVLLLQDRTYSADSSFVLQGKLGRGGLQGLAAQFGLSVPTADAAESPLFFADLARTRPVLNTVADSAKTVLGGKSLEDLFEVKGKTDQHRRQAALKELNDALGTAVSTKTGIVSFTLKTPEPNASAAVLDLIIRTMDRFNRTSQQSQAGSQRRFTEERVKATLEALRTAEDRLENFRLRNRVAGAPSLTLEEDRLRRDVTSTQSLLSSLQEAMEQARIEELRNTPVITVLEAPVAPIDPDPRHAARYAMVGAMFGGLLAAIYLLLTRLREVRGMSEEEASAEIGRLFGRGRTRSASA
ncbi:MAG: hypothetical protein ACO1Q7_06220 [Gemmatimonas sp.]